VQTACPQCAHTIVIDDARVPDRPFSVKCPKCQTVVKLAGKSPAAEGGEGLKTVAEAPVDGAARALLGLNQPPHAAAMTPTLARLGYRVDSTDDPIEAARLLEQGAYSVVVTNRTVAPQGKGETLYQRISRMSPDSRRRIFLVLVGDELKTGDGTQAFALLADLVLHTGEIGTADPLLKSTIAERTRLYQMFLDVRRRHEGALD
jgi:predicted Zn finger-like uncharacterized protein